jgi:hypothetical protein
MKKMNLIIALAMAFSALTAHASAEDVATAQIERIQAEINVTEKQIVDMKKSLTVSEIFSTDNGQMVVVYSAAVAAALQVISKGVDSSSLSAPYKVGVKAVAYAATAFTAGTAVVVGFDLKAISDLITLKQTQVDTMKMQITQIQATAAGLK